MEKMNFNYLTEADEVTLNLEKAKRALETAKTELEKAKLQYEDVFAKAEENGFQKPKLKKITEERALSILEFMNQPMTKIDKTKKVKKKADEQDLNMELNSSSENERVESLDL